jgi:hypothetical protein
MVLDELFAIFRAEARLVAIERQGGTCCCSGGDLARPQCRVDTDTLERCFCPDEVTGRHPQGYYGDRSEEERCAVDRTGHGPVVREDVSNPFFSFDSPSNARPTAGSALLTQVCPVLQSSSVYSSSQHPKPFELLKTTSSVSLPSSSVFLSAGPPCLPNQRLAMSLRERIAFISSDNPATTPTDATPRRSFE